MFLLLIRPRNLGDRVAEHLYGFLEDVIATLGPHCSEGHLDISAEKAVRGSFHEVVDSLPEYETTVVVFYGHGRCDHLLGFDGNAIIDLTNAAALRGRHAYVIACLSGLRLGPECVKKGALSYIGYSGEWILCWVDDVLAPGWKETANAGLRKAIDCAGYDPYVVFDAMTSAYYDWIDRHTGVYHVTIEFPATEEIQLGLQEVENDSLGFLLASALAYNSQLLCFHRDQTSGPGFAGIS